MDSVRFAYSFDREHFEGDLNTRQEALKTALNEVPRQDRLPEAIFVGKRVPIDAGSSGLAEMILAAMRRRVREQTDGTAGNFLMRVNEHQLAELDTEIDRVVHAWLEKNDLKPTQSRIVAISEHPVPQPAMKPAERNGDEVGEIGQTTFPVSLT
jgi:hypothetical protein